MYVKGRDMRLGQTPVDVSADLVTCKSFQLGRLSTVAGVTLDVDFAY